MSSINDPHKIPSGLPASMAQQHAPVPAGPGPVSDAEVFPLVIQLYSLEQVAIAFFVS